MFYIYIYTNIALFFVNYVRCKKIYRQTKNVAATIPAALVIQFQKSCQFFYDTKFHIVTLCDMCNQPRQKG